MTQFGLDPARLLRDYDAGGADEDEVITRKMLQKHVAEKLYYIKNIEWERGAEGFKKLKARNSRNARKQREAEHFTSWFDAMGNNQLKMATALAEHDTHFG